MLRSITDSLKKVFGTKQQKDISLYNPLVEEVNEQFGQLQGLSNDELRNKTKEFRARIAKHLEGIDKDIQEIHEEANKMEDFHKKEELFREMDKLQEERDKHLEDILKELLPEAFAVVKETARRFKENPVLEVTSTDHDHGLAATPGKSYVTIEGNKALWKNQWVAAGGDITWDMVHYDVQLIGGMVLHDGKIAEMATGEGKTLVATLPAYLNGLSGQGVHIVTVNDYLARRDSEWVGPIFEFLLLTVDCIDKYKPHSEERKKAYECDITYGTNNEFGFDYLRDNMVHSTEDMVQRKHHYAMVDEVDSVLVDDARTPLIISGPVSKDNEDQDYKDLKPQIERLYKTQKELTATYLRQAKKLFEEGQTGYQEGQAGFALLRAYRGLPKNRRLIKFLSEEGVKVELQKAENFYMQEQNKHMHLVDEDLYFIIDEKNRSVELTEKGAEYLSQGQEDDHFFIMPDITTEMVEIEKMFGEFYTEKIGSLDEKWIEPARALLEEGLIAEEGEELKKATLPKAEAIEKYGAGEPLLTLLTRQGLIKLKEAENGEPVYELADAHLIYPILEARQEWIYNEKKAEAKQGSGQDQLKLELEKLEKQWQDARVKTEAKKEEAKRKLTQDFAVKSKRLHSVSQLLKAYTLFERDEDYVVIEGQVKIVDEQTGRMMEGRRYSDGLHQALEAKEEVEVGNITQTYATVTLQNYFRMYHKLAGMTGTAETEASEFWEIYKLDVVVIPTNRPIIRDDREDLVYKTTLEKFNAVIQDIQKLSEAGRPVLVGTTSVDISEKLSRLLDRSDIGISHNVLNAKQHQREAEIVAEAGQPGKVTIATNMAGRGTDIKLAPETIYRVVDVKKDSSAKGGYFYTIRQGKTDKEITLDENHELWPSFQLDPEMYTLVRKKDPSEKEKKKLLVGGLAIIGTERHDSRRVDRQLRGRAGRQGDPGSSQFYVSLEDNLMRLFQSERIAKLMDRMGHQEGEVIQHSMVTKSIERAQKKVEENNFGIRKRLLEYDDVMNIQREAIYKKRKNTLDKERLSVDLNNMFTSLIRSNVEDCKEEDDYLSLKIFIEKLGIPINVDEKTFKSTSVKGLIESLTSHVLGHYTGRYNKLAEEWYPIIRNFLNNVVPKGGEELEEKPRLGIPFKIDAHNIFPVIFKTKDLLDKDGDAIRSDIEKVISLQIIDQEWKEHLRTMDELKDSSQAASFEQKDPLLVYKMEAFNLFERLIYKINDRVVSALFQGTLGFDDDGTFREAKELKVDFSKMSTNRVPGESSNRRSRSRSNKPKHRRRPTHQPITVQESFGRNERVTVQYKDGRKKEDKYKRLERDILSGKCVIVGSQKAN